MKEIIIQQLKLKLNKDKDYDKDELKKIVNKIIQQNDIELSLYIKIAKLENPNIDDITKTFYEKKILLNK